MFRRTFCLGALAAAFLLCAVGCSRNKPVKVEGTVTLDGKPVSGATVMFVPEAEGGKPANGVTGTDGSFRLTTFSSGDGALPGSYKVVVKLDEPPDVGPMGGAAAGDPKQMAEMMRKFAEQQKAAKDKGVTTKKKSKLPETYGDEKRTPLKQQVPADGSIKIELRSSGS